jgi:NAD(P)H-dependent flavin oxidoreductase YrpB (nitropropane dioxygenase family)
MAGQLGVVSGTGIESIFVRRLQDLGVDEGLRAVLDTFPDQSFVESVLARYTTPRRPGSSTPYRAVPMLTHRNVHSTQDLMVLASFAEVAQAKAGHDGLVGMNLLTKVQIPTVPTLYGAILAGVDYVLMGAGIPLHIPEVLDRLTRGEAVEMPLDVVGEADKKLIPLLRFDPSRLPAAAPLRRPEFLGIVSSHVLANALAKRSSGVVNGFVVESPIAGGHNAPPRGALTLDEGNNPIYGERDRVDYAAMRDLGLPFWLAGGITTPEHVRAALEVGATGVQVGTLFAYCRESGMEDGLRHRVIDQVLHGGVHVATSVRASSTGYPFKVAQVEGTLSDEQVYEDRPRVCDLGYLREAYMKPDGTIGYRCPSEPQDQFVAKGGQPEETVERTCLCNALMSTAGFGQIRRHGYHEPPIVTSGDAINEIAPLLKTSGDYGALDVIELLRAGVGPEVVAHHDV